MNVSDDFSADRLNTVNAELDVTCAGARELSLVLPSETDHAERWRALPTLGVAASKEALYPWDVSISRKKSDVGGSQGRLRTGRPVTCAIRSAILSRSSTL